MIYIYVLDRSYRVETKKKKNKQKETLPKKKPCPSRKAYLEASITLQTGVTVLVMSQQDS